MPGKKDIAKSREAGGFEIPSDVPKSTVKEGDVKPFTPPVRTQVYTDADAAYIANRNRAHSIEAQNRALEEELGVDKVDVNEPDPSVEQPKQKGLWDAVASGFGDIDQQIVAGSLNAFNELGNGLLDAARWAEKQIGKTNFVPEERAHGFGNMVMGDPETTAGAFANSIGQFVTGFLPTNRAMSGIKVFRGAKGALSIAKGMASGGITDFTFFDPHQERLSNLIQAHPSLANPVSAYLAAKPGDSEVEGRIKNTLEGMGLGVMAEGLMHGLRAMRGWRGVEEASRSVTAGVEEGVPVKSQPAPAAAADEGIPAAANAEAVPVREATDAEIKKAAADSEFEAVKAMNPEERAAYFKQFKDPADAQKAFEAEQHTRARLPDGRFGLGMSKRGLELGDKAPMKLLNQLDEKEFRKFQAEGKYDGMADPRALDQASTGTAREAQAHFSPFGQTGYRHVQDVEVTFPDGTKLVDAIEGNDAAHAMDRAETNWPGAKVRSIGADEAMADGHLASGDAATRAQMDEAGRVAKDEDAPSDGKVPRGTERRAEPGIVERFQGDGDVVSFSAKKAQELVEGAPPRIIDSSGLDLGDKVININLNKIDGTTDLKTVIAQIGKSFGLDMEAARRGVIPDKVVMEMAQDLGMNRFDLMKRFQGQALNAEQITAARMLLNASADDLVKKARAATGAGASDIEKAAFLNAIEAHRAIQMHVTGATAEAGRALRALRQVVGLPGEKERAQAIRTMVSAFETGIDGAKVEDLAKNIAAMDNVQDISNFIRKSLGGRLFDAAMEVRINNLLSGAKTFTVNMISNTYSMFGKVGERYLAEGLGKLKGGSPMNADRVASGEAWAMLSAQIDGIKDGFALVRQAIRDRRPIDGITQVPVSRIPAISAQNFPEVPMLGHALDYLGTMVRLPGNGLNLADAFFKAVNYRMELQALGHREAIYRGLGGTDYDEFMDKFLRNPPEDIRFKAAEEARINTFTNLRPETGLLSENTIRGIQSNPLGRIALPFLRTNFNLIDYTMQRIPGLHLISPTMMQDIAAGGARKDLAHAKLAFGSSIMVITGSLAARGLITGGGPEDPDAKKALMSTGWRPYSVKVDDTYYAYNRVEPLGTIMGMAADWTEIAGHVKGEGQDVGDMALLAAATAANIGPAENLVESAIDMGELLTDPKKNAKKYISTNMASSIVPGWLRQFTREGDDPKLDVKATDWELGQGRARFVKDDSVFRETLNRIKASIPGYGKDLPPQRNMFGEIVNYDPGWGPDIASPIASNKMVDSPVRKEIARLSLLGYKFDMPSDHVTTKMGAIPLTPHQYERFVELSAGIDLKHPQMRRKLEDELNYQVSHNFPAYSVDKKYKTLDENKYSMLMDIIQSYRKAATKQIGMEDIGRDLPVKYTELSRVKYKNVTGRDAGVPIKPPGGGVVR